VLLFHFVLQEKAMTILRQDDVLVCARDAEGLAAMLGAHRRANPFEADASDELADLLMDARFIATGVPEGRITMGSTVTYLEEPGGARRTVTLVYPDEADAGRGRISVLSPIGLALIGRQEGAVVMPTLPNGRKLAIRIVEATGDSEPLRKAA
jgi:regulator of nucleoside diphosphate kinase